METEGEIESLDRGYDLTLHTVRTSFGSISWNNDGDEKLQIDPEGLHVRKFEMNNENQRLSLAGTFRGRGALDAQLKLQKVNLAGLGYYFHIRELIPENQRFTGDLDLTLELQGTLASPLVHLVTSCNELGYRGKRIGTLTSLLDYRDQKLNGKIKIDSKKQNATDPPDLMLNGTIPIDLAFTAVEKRFPDEQIELGITSTGFELNVLDPLLASFDDLQGTVTGNVHVGGTPNQPVYNGSLNLTDVKF